MNDKFAYEVKQVIPKAIATRNRVIRGYLGIDDNVVWSIIIEEIPDLLDLLQKLRANLNK